jgi:DNA-directed RNA polymerase subunit H (RpoH/RPB5)
MNKTLLSLEESSRNLIVSSWPNVVKMLMYRGYNTTHLPMLVGLSTPWNETGPHITAAHPTTKDVVHVVFMTNKLTVAVTDNLFSLFTANKQKHCILIMEEKPKAKAKTKIKQCKTIDIEVFKYSFFGSCPVEHGLVPEHKVLTKAETEETLREYNLEKKKMSLQRIDEVISEYYHLKYGDVVKYARKYPTGIHYYYRLVSPDAIK